MMEQPGITRRGVLRGAVIGAAALALGGTAVASPLLSAVSAAGTTKALPGSGFKFTQAVFSPLVGKAFKVQVDGAWRTIVLDAVMAKTTAGSQESFSLLFDGLTPAFHQNTYQVQQASLGQFAMFVAPVNQTNRMQRYESVVNNRQQH